MPKFQVTFETRSLAGEDLAFSLDFRFQSSKLLIALDHPHHLADFDFGLRKSTQCSLWQLLLAFSLHLRRIEFDFYRVST